jgi:uncharacterized membrane protein
VCVCACARAPCTGRDSMPITCCQVLARPFMVHYIIGLTRIIACMQAFMVSITKALSSSAVVFTCRSAWCVVSSLLIIVVLSTLKVYAHQTCYGCYRLLSTLRPPPPILSLLRGVRHLFTGGEMGRSGAVYKAM